METTTYSFFFSSNIIGLFIQVLRGVLGVIMADGTNFNLFIIIASYKDGYVVDSLRDGNDSCCCVV